MTTMNEAASFVLNNNQPRSENYNIVWGEFLDTFFINRYIDGYYSDVRPALAYALEPLKELAEKENWGPNDTILVSYFVHTFYELRKAQRNNPDIRYIVEYEDWIYFNTGLITENMERIYATFQKNYKAASRGTEGKPQYFLSYNPNNFMREIHMSEYCYPLPDRCCYFDDYTQLIMDGTKEPIVHWTHIVDENWERICEILYGKDKCNDEEFKRRQQYDAQTRLEGALKLARNRVLTNYRTAVPQSYKGELQLLLPLCLKKASKPDFVLTLTRQDSKPPIPGVFTYTARTILTLSMAYQNARLVARPEKDWLIAEDVVPTMEDEIDDYE
ncbi:unnamed protein product [Adineta ricciae]|uniref:DUF3825 domain-containing protein n=1 Tax=Adineta ricciae TaxID=249248 RepID=A0A815E5P5_ADIRI|nr:unnamed protein product [Adineta ricciae]